MNVILQGDGKPFGVLEVDSRSEDEFAAPDLAFLQGAANILGMAIERERHERSLKAALARQQVLLQEIRHRVKNSLAIVASMLAVQSNYAGNPDVTRHLQDAANRISAVAKAHERIDQGNGADRLDLGIYIEQICRDLDEAVNNCTIEVDAAHGIIIMTDRAIPIALIANELITNAAKYAYPSPLSGIIRVRLAQHRDGDIALSVRDEGAGLPSDFDIRRATGLGMRLVRAFSQQLNAKFTANRLTRGTEFMVTVPREL